MINASKYHDRMYDIDTHNSVTVLHTALKSRQLTIYICMKASRSKINSNQRNGERLTTNI